MLPSQYSSTMHSPSEMRSGMNSGVRGESTEGRVASAAGPDAHCTSARTTREQSTLRVARRRPAGDVDVHRRGPPTTTRTADCRLWRQRRPGQMGPRPGRGRAGGAVPRSRFRRNPEGTELSNHCRALIPVRNGSVHSARSAAWVLLGSAIVRWAKVARPRMLGSAIVRLAKVARPRMLGSAIVRLAKVARPRMRAIQALLCFSHSRSRARDDPHRDRLRRAGRLSGLSLPVARPRIRALRTTEYQDNHSVMGTLCVLASLPQPELEVRSLRDAARQYPCARPSVLSPRAPSTSHRNKEPSLHREDAENAEVHRRIVSLCVLGVLSASAVSVET